MARTGTNVRKQAFWHTPDGKNIDLYTLTNANGMELRVITYGGIVVSLQVPDHRGRLADVVLGFDRLSDYIKHNPYFGALIGRYGNRIAQGRFTLNGRDYQLARNNGDNHLHGGWRGFDKVIWQAQVTAIEDGAGLSLTYLSPDGEEGYPGNLSVGVTYALTDSNEWRIKYRATTDQETVVNLTQHSYFNLAGRGNVLDHELVIHADEFTPIDSGLIPTGELRKVRGTPMDFTQPTAIGARLDDTDEQLRFAGGYDHNWVLHNDQTIKLAASVYEPKSERRLEVYTTQPGLQFYSGNFLDGSLTGKDGRVYQQHAGFCLETQHYPDSPNHPNFPTTVLKPGEEYRTTTIYQFLAA